MSDTTKKVMRWTSADTRPAPDAGGFVAYGDYLEITKALAAASKDAERYRWLRIRQAEDGGYWVAHGRLHGGLSQWSGEGLDAALDKEMNHG